MLKHISLFCVTLFLCLSSAAGQKIDKHGNFFATGGRKIVVVTPKDLPQYNDELSQFFISCGAQVMEGFFARLIYANVSLARTSIDGGQGRGFSIRVSGSSIKIHYTHPQYIDAAITALKSLYADPYAQRMILGVNVSFDEKTPTATPSNIKVNNGILDCSSKFNTVSAIQQTLKRQATAGKRDIIILVGSPSAFRLKLNCFNLFNPVTAITPKSESYTAAAIGEIFKFAAQNNIRLTLGVDLLSENANFEKWTAHKLSSVEGMRLVRAMIEELSTKWGVRRLYIGSNTTEAAADSRYRAFLAKIATDNKMELVIL